MPALPLPVIQADSQVPLPQGGGSPLHAAHSFSDSVGGLIDLTASTVDREQRQADAEARAFAARQQHDEAVLAVTKASGEEHVTSLQSFSDAQKTGLAGFTDQWLKDFDQRTEAGAESIPSAGQSLYRQHMAALRSELNVKFFQAESGARDLKLVDDAKTNNQTSAQIAFIDPNQAAPQIAMRKADIDALSLPANERAVLSEHATQTIAYSAASTMAERNPAGFLASVSNVDAFKANPVLSSLAPENLRTLRSHAESLLAQQQNAATRAQDERNKIAGETFSALKGFTVSGQQPDLDYVARVKQDTKGTPYEGASAQLLDIATKNAAFGSMTLPQQKATLAQFDAQASANGTDPEKQELRGRLQTINDQQTAAYKENPWVAANRFAHVPAQPEVQIGSPEQGLQVISRRLGSMSTIETAAGGPVSPLQPSEASAWSASLAKLSVENRADVLAAAGAQLNGGQISALADQVAAKDKATALMLKTNDQTSAGRAVSVRVGLGAQGLQDKTVKADETAQAGWRAEIANSIRGTLGNTAAENDAIEAAYLVRASFELPSSTAPGFDPSTKSNENAVALVLGQPIERGGVKTVLPKGMDESSFNDKLRSFTPEVLKPMAPDGKVYMGATEVPLNLMSARIVDYGLRLYSPGVYVPVRGNTIITTDKAGTQPLKLKVQ
jgi:hypothetical protein